MSDSVRLRRAWRYPVKSMLGQSVDAIDIVAPGVVGDRRYAIRDAGGRLGSGKNTDRFRRIDGLFRFRACYDDERAVLSLPDGTEIDAEDPAIDARLSAVLGQPVTLAREDDGSHVDDSPLHLLTTASLAWLERSLPDARADERRFRPNLVLDCPGAEPVEQAWIGRTLQVGEQVVLQVTEPTTRCGMIALEQDELPRDPRVLRHITREADLLFGVYARVLQPGRASVGDRVTLA